ncbi:galactosyltransferase-related protein [uncultured Croceicoccus sp.]|uniref:galactosyltransferase-related protein n=1 Tax=uncultured Croceicoccus sp. TaxID=1295329 RepID=UPI0026135E56|nr:galactosyltransferase-related protein [uncultured Croceicoccus sp.]
MKISICTLASGRAAHLRNLVLGLMESERAPDELIVAVLQDAPYDLPAASFPVTQIVLGSDGVPLSLGRNTAAGGASGDLLIFLDVDCVPHPALVGDYAKVARDHGGVLMGEVGYLPRGATANGVDFAHFERVAVRHSERPGPPEAAVGPCRDYRCFWSLNFAISAADFARTGGFDERYTGYGGEDTDFGRVVAACGLPLQWVRGAKAYHQYHPHHMPPVHHLDSVMANAHRFAEKWGEPTMQHWMRAFTLMGLTRRDGAGWVKLREPEERDLALTRQEEDQPYASSARVLDLLERAAAKDAASIAAE